MIPKVIHYCWFGRNPLPPLAIKCIESWKKFLPDYEIKEWNEDNFDVNIIPYTSEAYSAKKYAFVSDYARFWILYNYGGLYFDTDVEIIRPINDIIEKGNFWGCEGSYHNKNILSIAPGLGIGCISGHYIYKKLLDYYSNLHFIEGNSLNYVTIVEYTTNIFKELGWEQKNVIQQIYDMNIYPTDYFSPIDLVTNKLTKTRNTRSIHWYAGSWKDNSNNDKIIKFIRKFLPSLILVIYNKIKHLKNK